MYNTGHLHTEQNVLKRLKLTQCSVVKHAHTSSIAISCTEADFTGVATMGPRGAMAPSLLSYFSIP